MQKDVRRLKDKGKNYVVCTYNPYNLFCLFFSVSRSLAKVRDCFVSTTVGEVFLWQPHFVIPHLKLDILHF